MRLSAIPIDTNNWMYVETDALEVIHWVVDASGRRRAADTIRIPWSQVRIALASQDKRRLPRKAVAKDGTAGSRRGGSLPAVRKATN